ncbi:integrase, catalytic region, zinc finger, CCHC-type containing protein [Tanacetum coccineum]
MSVSLSKTLKELQQKLIEEAQEMLNIFESMEQKVEEKSPKEYIFQNKIDRLLEVSLTRDCVLISVEEQKNELLKNEIEKSSSDSKDIQANLLKRIKILENDFKRSQAQSIDFELKLQHQKEKMACDVSWKSAFQINDIKYCFVLLGGKDVFMLSHKKCAARYALSKDSRVKGTLFTTPGCSKHMTGNLQLLRNFIEKFTGTVRFVCEQGKSNKLLTSTKTGSKHRIQTKITSYGYVWANEVESINDKKYILVIVDDYSWYTWVYFLRTKDEAPDMIINFINQVQQNLMAQILKIQIDNGTEFKNKKLRSFYAKLGIVYHTSTAQTPQQNGVVE